MILDIMMPKYSGTEVARILRLDSKFNNTPIVIVTASTSDELEKAAMKWGIDKYLRKPFELSHLVETVASLLDREKSSRSVEK